LIKFFQNGICPGAL
jgi:hypothetical protein